MNLLKSISRIASASVVSQVIGAMTIWLLSHQYNMAVVGGYALTYSIVLIGAQLCTYATQLLLPKQPVDKLAQNIIYSILQSIVMAGIYTGVCFFLFDKESLLIFSLTLGYALMLISENLLLRDEKIKLLTYQRLSLSILVVCSVFFTPTTLLFYITWAAGLMVLIIGWLVYSMKNVTFTASLFSWKSNVTFAKESVRHIRVVGSAEVLAIVNGNLPTILITFWFSPLVVGYFAVVNRFCLAPVIIVGNAVRNSIFSKWSIDFRNDRFNFAEYKKVRLLLLGLGVLSTAAVGIFYPLVMQYGFSDEWQASIPTAWFMLPYLFPALAVCPLTVIELVYGEPRYFLQIQIEQLLVVLLAFGAFPYFHPDYEYSVLMFAVLSFIRYAFIYIKVNKRADSMKVSYKKQEVVADE